MADAPQVTYAGPWPEPQQHSRHSALSQQQKWEEAPQVHHAVHGSKAKHTILGLRRRNFWILSLLALILIGAIVGGSVGGIAAVEKKKNTAGDPSLQRSDTPQDSSSAGSSFSASTLPSQSVSSKPFSSTVSSNADATYTPRPPASVIKIDTSCPPDLRLRSWTGDTYTCAATTDINGKGDITGLVAYTVQACVDACSSLNRVQSAKICVAVAVNQMLAGDYAKQGANCYLKNITGPTHPGNTGATFLTLDQ